MNHETLKSILEHLAEEAIPTAEIDLWPAIQASYETSKSILPQPGEYSMKANLAHNRRLSLAATAALALLILLAAILASPQGQVWARNIWSFFNNAGSDTRPLPTVPVVLYEVTPGVPVPTSTPLPGGQPAFYEECGDWAQPRCSPEQIKDRVQFEIKMLAVIPEGMRFAGGTGGPDQVWLSYECSGESHCALILVEEPWKDDPTQKIQVAANAQVEEVPINGVVGEYVRGSWADSTDQTTWDPNSSAQFLRWVEDGILYQIITFGEEGHEGEPAVDTVQFNRNSMAALAETLSAELPPADSLNDLDHLASPGATEALAGFDLLEPAQLPDGYTFDYASYSQGSHSVCLHYRSVYDEFDPSLHIIESPSATLPEVEQMLSGNPEVKDPIFITRTLTIGGVDGGHGLFVWGDLHTGGQCGGEKFYAGEALLWSADGLQFQIYAPGIAEFASYLSQGDLVKLAESLTGVLTIPEDALDPDHLPSPESAKALASFEVRLPTRLPPGEAFSHAAYDQERQQVLLVYKDISIAETLLGLDTGSPLDRYANYPAEAIEDVKIGDVSGVYVQGCWGGSLESGPSAWDKGCSNEALVWQADGVGYSIYANLYIGSARETLIGIAEGLR